MPHERIRAAAGGVLIQDHVYKNGLGYEYLREQWRQRNLDNLQEGLDVIGLAPVIGEVADILNASISFARGDNVGASLSLAASVPFLGYGAVAGKVAAKGGTNLVYQGIDKAGVVRYVGITEREAAVRFGEHLSSGTAKSLLRYEVVPWATNLSRTGARVWEQTLINQHGLQKNGGLLLNKINSISPANWWQYGIK